MRTKKYLHKETDMETKIIPHSENSCKITLEEFAVKVKKMRLYQRRYFNTRDLDVLAESKKLESEVDAMIGEIFNRQMKLF